MSVRLAAVSFGLLAAGCAFDSPKNAVRPMQLERANDAGKAAAASVPPLQQQEPSSSQVVRNSLPSADSILRSSCMPSTSAGPRPGSASWATPRLASSSGGRASPRKVGSSEGSSRSTRPDPSVIATPYSAAARAKRSLTVAAAGVPRFYLLNVFQDRRGCLAAMEDYYPASLRVPIHKTFMSGVSVGRAPD